MRMRLMMLGGKIGVRSGKTGGFNHIVPLLYMSFWKWRKRCKVDQANFILDSESVQASDDCGKS